MSRIFIASVAMLFAGAACAVAWQCGRLRYGLKAGSDGDAEQFIHAAGSSVGGLFSIPVARTPGGGAIVTQFMWISSGGATTQLLVRLWDVKPSGSTTCTDQTAFVSNATDDTHLITIPFTVTPAAPANTTGDAKTYAVNGFTPPISIRNQDASQTQYVYACVLTTATDTADESAAVYVNLTARRTSRLGHDRDIYVFPEHGRIGHCGLPAHSNPSR